MPVKFTKNYGREGFTATGGEFPIYAVTSNDVGKVIALIENPDGSMQYGLVGPSSLTDFIVTFSGDSVNENAACDKTWAEIKDAYDAGKNIKCQYRYSNKILSLSAPEFTFAEDILIQLTACVTTNISSAMTNYYCSIDFNETIEVDTYAYSVQAEE